MIKQKLKQFPYMLQAWLKWDNSAGFTIAEMIVAVALLAFGIILIYGSFFMVFNSTMSVGPKLTATYLAQEGQEIIRNVRDNNLINNASWSLGLSSGPCSSGCQADYKTMTYSQLSAYGDTVLGLDSYGFYSYDGGAVPTQFKRKITVSAVTVSAAGAASVQGVIKVTVLVTWTYNNKPFSLTSQQYLYKR